MSDIVSYATKSERKLPDKLYKFKPFSSYSKTYFNGNITLSNPTSLNDPFDCHLGILWENLRHYQQLHNFFKISGIETHSLHDSLNLFNKYKRNWSSFENKFYKDMDETLRVCSLGSCLHNYLLWSHYAGSHNGFCIELDTINLIQYLTEKFGERNNLKLAEVIYEETAPSLDPLHINFVKAYELNLTTKSKSWGYEKEWRIILSEEGLTKFHEIELKPEVISAVYFGEKSDSWDIWDARIKLKAFDPNIKCYIFKRVQREFTYAPELIAP